MNNMTLVQIAGVMIRIFSIMWFVDAAWCMADLPGDLFGIFHYQTAAPSTQTGIDRYLAEQREIHLLIILLKALIYFCLGIIFLFLTRPLAKLLTKGLNRPD